MTTDAPGATRADRRSPDPEDLAVLLRACFGELAFSVRAAAVASCASVGRAHAELEVLRVLGVVCLTEPGYYRAVADARADPGDGTPGEQIRAIANAREDLARWYLASARAASRYLPSPPLLPASTPDLLEPDPAIVDGFSASIWFQREREQVLRLARWCTGRAGTRRLGADLAYAGIQPAVSGRDLAAWEELARQMLEAGELAGDEGLQALALEQTGKSQSALREFEGAEATLRKALALYQGIGDQAGVVSVTNALGLVLVRGGASVEAESYFVQVLAASGVLGDLDHVAYAQQNLAWCLLEQKAGREREAIALAESAVARHLETETPQARANALGLAASAYRLSGQVESALALAYAAVAASDASGHTGLSGYEYAELGRCLCAAGRPGEADAWFEMAFALLRAAGDEAGEQRIRQEVHPDCG